MTDPLHLRVERAILEGLHALQDLHERWKQLAATMQQTEHLLREYMNSLAELFATVDQSRMLRKQRPADPDQRP